MVLATAREAGAEAVWSLGDVVGYGADPGRCVELVAEHAQVALAGNHDLAVTGVLDVTDFSGPAAAAAIWTAGVLSPEQLAVLEAAVPDGAAEGFGLYHASPRDPVWEYVLSVRVADLCLDAQAERIALVGHSHVALSFGRPELGPTEGSTRGAGDVIDLSDGHWLLNPGSVGQPRDGDPRAAWMLLDTEAQLARWERTEYDVAGAQAAIRAAGLPGNLADRLEYGQ